MNISKNDIFRYTPGRFAGQDGAPVYLLKALSKMDRAQHARDVSATGARCPTSAELVYAMRSGVTEIVHEDDRTRCHSLLDAFEAKTLDADGEKALAELEQVMLRTCVHYAAIVAERNYYMQVAPMIAFQRFVLGWENVAHEYKRSGNRIADDVFEQIDDSDVAEVGWAVLVRDRFKESDAKKSPSPSPSGGSQQPSAECDPLTEGAAGSSTA